MANANSSLFYWYRRYRVRAQDMTDFQTAMLEGSRGLGEGAVGGSVLVGFEVTLPGVMDIDFAEGIACGPTGNLLVTNAVENITVEAPTGAFPVKSLVVARPLLVDDDYITKPTSPFDSVPLRQIQRMEVVVIDGTPAASPVYPSKEANDVILVGLKLDPSTVSLTDEDNLDFTVRESVGKNTDLGEFQGYRYIVSSTKKLATHSSAAKLFADPDLLPNCKILIDEDQNLVDTITIETPNIVVEFSPGVTITDDGAATGFDVAASGVHLVRPRMVDFTSAIQFNVGGDYGVVMTPRYNNCASEMDDSSSSTGAQQVAPFTET